MKALRPLFACCLALVWVPLTLHCAVEASGILEGRADSCCDPDYRCTDAPCALVSNGEYNPAVPSVKLFAPALVAWIDCVPIRELLPPPSGTAT